MVRTIIGEFLYNFSLGNSFIINKNTENRLIHEFESSRIPTVENRDINPCRPDPRRREKINLNFYFQTSLGYLKWFYEGLKCLKGLKCTGQEGLRNISNSDLFK